MYFGYRVDHDCRAVGQYHKGDHPLDGLAPAIGGCTVEDPHDCAHHGVLGVLLFQFLLPVANSLKLLQARRTAPDLKSYYYMDAFPPTTTIACHDTRTHGGTPMRFVIIQNLITASKRLRPRIELSAPSEDQSGPKRRDRTGFILFLVAIALVITVIVLS
jgi:hypothetical protein